MNMYISSNNSIESKQTGIQKMKQHINEHNVTNLCDIEFNYSFNDA